MQRRIEGWSFSRVKDFLAYYLLDDSQYIDVQTMPEWLFMLVDDTIPARGSAGGRAIPMPVIYEDNKAQPYGPSTNTTEEYYLLEKGDPQNLPYDLSTTPPEYPKDDFYWYDIYTDWINRWINVGPWPVPDWEDRSTCRDLYFHPTKLCSPEYLPDDFVLFVSNTLTEDLVVIGKPVLEFHCNEIYSARYNFTAILGEIPDGESDNFWPITSERFFLKTDTGVMDTYSFELDTAVHRFKEGNRICLSCPPCLSV